MSLHVLHAGAGYRYLLRTTAAGDGANPADGLAAYYAASGTPPGVWVGGGLAGLNDGHGHPSGLPVDETTLGRLFGRGHDPVTGQPLGRGLATRRLPDGSSTVVGVAGFDLTFSVPKSVSILWALGDQNVQEQVVAAHHATIDVVLGWAEREIVVTRTGHAGVTPLRTRGLVAARFDHYDSRTGDPNLHSHLAVANRVQGEDGVWRALDARLLHAAGVAMSELYDTLYADELTRRLGVTWQQVDRGPGRNPGFEIAGIDPGLLDGFSTRSHAITPHTEQLIADFTAQHGRPPSGPEMTRLRQTATLATRPAKTIRPLAELRSRWRRQAAEWTADTPEQLLAPALPRPDGPTGEEGAVAVMERPVQLDLFDPAVEIDRTPVVGTAEEPQMLTYTDVDPDAVTRYADVAVAGVEARRSSWTPLNLMAETARATRNLRMASVMDRMLLLDHTRDTALDGLVALHDPAAVHPAHAWRAKWTSPAILDSEQALLAATHTPAAAIEESFVARVLDTAGTPMGDYYGLPDLSPEQAAAVTHLATQPTRLRVLEGPAGSGKTTTLRALAVLWQARAGQGSVIGLAPSAGAAATLQAALRVPCENTAKWLHETTGPAGQQRAALAAQLLTAPVGRAVRGPLLRDVLAEQSRWTLPYRALLVVDEASLADTHTLAALTAQAHAAHAVILLVGDRHQGSPVGAGGAFGLLARHTHHAELAALHRYHHAWEAHATLGLRHGHPDALAAYAAHDRLHTAPAGTPPDDERDLLLDQAHTAWAADTTAGKHALLLAADTATVTELNARARTHRLAHGQVSAHGVPLRDGTTAGVGDHLHARHNDRQLTDTHGGWVRNGDPLTLTALYPDGSATATRRDTPTGQTPATVRLPAGYLAEHIDLGYAITVHRAQGLTADTAHLVLTPGTTREALYVGLTRGRESNNAWITTTPTTGTDGHDVPGLHRPTPTPADVLHHALTTSSAEPSATELLAELTRRADIPDARRPQMSPAPGPAGHPGPTLSL